MLRRLAALLILCGFTSAPQGLYGTEEIERIMSLPGVQTGVTWRDCGEVNGYYLPIAHRVVMCNELRAFRPGLIRYVLAHELAHGIIQQLDVPITGTEEWAADELAAVMLLATGHGNDVLEGAEFWLSWNRPEDPFDPHLGDQRRFFDMACLVFTHDGSVVRGCHASYRRSLSAWVRLLRL